MSEIILEGSDFTGKTTLDATLQQLEIPTSDRSEHISSHMQLSDVEPVERAIDNAAESIRLHHADDLVVLLVAQNPNILINRRNKAGASDAYDLHAEQYNQLYTGLADRLVGRGAPNVAVIPIDNLSLHDTTRRVVEPWIGRHLHGANLDNPTVEGRSKRIHALEGLGTLAVTELKPSLFSITHNRYDENVQGTDTLRTQFWELFGQHLNSQISAQAFGGPGSPEMHQLLEAGIVTAAYPFISNFLGKTTLGDKELIITRFADSLPPIEVIWKKYLVGTMKHRLREIDQHRMRNGDVLQYEAELPEDIVRFDWRNPLPDEQLKGSAARPVEDETIPEDFANLYINVANARQVSRAVARATDSLLRRAGYKFVDTCYFMNAEGSMVFSELTPDGMRIKRIGDGSSFDKDLWRQGKDSSTLQRIWGQLLADLKIAASDEAAQTG